MTDYSSVGDFLLKEGCLAFTSVMFEAVNKQPFRIAPHHRIICHKLDQVLRGEHPTNRLMFNIPPRHSKTELAVVSFSAIGFAINPRSEFMHLSRSTYYPECYEHTKDHGGSQLPRILPKCRTVQQCQRKYIHLKRGRNVCGSLYGSNNRIWMR